VVRGEGFTISGKPNSLRPPVLPLAAAASMLLCGGSQDTIVKLPNLAFSLLALFIVYWCATTVHDQMTGLAAATFLGVSPSFWTSTPLFLTEIPFMAFFTAAVVFFYFGLYRHQRYFSWSWLCWGIAFLTRYTAVLFAPIVGLFLILAFCARNPEVQHRMWSKHFFLSPCAGLLVVVPWLFRQQFTFGNALVGMQEAATQLQVYRPDVSMPWYFYLVHLPEMFSPGLTVLLVIGIIWMVWKRERFGLHCDLGVGELLSLQGSTLGDGDLATHGDRSRCRLDETLFPDSSLATILCGPYLFACQPFCCQLQDDPPDFPAPNHPRISFVPRSDAVLARALLSRRSCNWRKLSTDPLVRRPACTGLTGRAAAEGDVRELRVGYPH